ncbi:MAG: hypothetical protein RLZZ423_1352 [Cyanobacteriota bacterium]
MALTAAQSFIPPAIPWRQPRALAPLPDPGPGLDPGLLRQALERLCAVDGVQAVVLFGSRARGEAQEASDLDLAVILSQPQLTPQQKAAAWRRCREALGSPGVGVDLVLAGASEADRLSQSRWHVFGDVAREGRVLYVAG